MVVEVVFHSDGIQVEYGQHLEFERSNRIGTEQQ